MFSPELMKFIIKYQDKESLYPEKKEENKEIKLSNTCYTNLATVVIESKH